MKKICERCGSGEVVYLGCAPCPHCEFGGGKLD